MGRGVPDLHDSVTARGDQDLAVRAERDGDIPWLMSLQDDIVLRIINAPESNGSVRVGRGRAIALGIPSHRDHACLVTIVLADLTIILRIPHPHGLIVAA